MAREDKARLEEAAEEKGRVEVELLRTRRAKEELEMAADEQLCCVCMDRPKMVMFEPCRHVSVCKQCAPRISQCPLCKTDAARKVVVYL